MFLEVFWSGADLFLWGHLEDSVMKKSSVLLMATLLFFGAIEARPGGFLGSETVVDRAAEREEIARVIGSVIGWARDKNLALFYGSIANDDDYISVTPGKRVVKRFEDVKQSVPLWMSPDFVYVRHELKDLEITFARCGEVAWFYCVLDDINTYRGEPASWENARWTGVVEKRDGKWVVVSQHFSFADER